MKDLHNAVLRVYKMQPIRFECITETPSIHDLSAREEILKPVWQSLDQVRDIFNSFRDARQELHYRGIKELEPGYSQQKIGPNTILLYGDGAFLTMVQEQHRNHRIDFFDPEKAVLVVL